MSSLTDDGLEFCSSGRSPAERQKVLAELRKQLPPAGPVSERGGSPLERKIALLVEFLLCMLRGEAASVNILAHHSAYAGRSFNFTGQWCKKIGLQWNKVGGKTVYPATGANMLKLCDELNKNAPDQLERVARQVGKCVDELIDFAIDKFQEESFEPVDEFVDLPEDFQVSDCIESDSVMSHLEEMFRPFNATPVASVESSVAPQSGDSNSERESHQESVAALIDVSIHEHSSDESDAQQIQAILKNFNSPQELRADANGVPRPETPLSDSCGAHSSLPDSVSVQSPE